MAKQSQYHIIAHKDGWAVIREGNKRASSVHSTKKEAVAAGKMKARNGQYTVIIHGKDGEVQNSQIPSGSISLKKPREVILPRLKSDKKANRIKQAVIETMNEMKFKS